MKGAKRKTAQSEKDGRHEGVGGKVPKKKKKKKGVAWIESDDDEHDFWKEKNPRHGNQKTEQKQGHKLMGFFLKWTTGVCECFPPSVARIRLFVPPATEPREKKQSNCRNGRAGNREREKEMVRQWKHVRPLVLSTVRSPLPSQMYELDFAIIGFAVNLANDWPLFWTLFARRHLDNLLLDAMKERCGRIRTDGMEMFVVRRTQRKKSGKNKTK
ncbi:hypothetical protein niasHT_037548 [Heterodera trifolii]|uniref:Uncharacterized protein n=1 Tax=Heterodera trifolii TaxID=157864 RepID=A0ABD2ITD4_9BILA